MTAMARDTFFPKSVKENSERWELSQHHGISVSSKHSVNIFYFIQSRGTRWASNPNQASDCPCPGDGAARCGKTRRESIRRNGRTGMPGARCRLWLYEFVSVNHVSSLLPLTCLIHDCLSRINLSNPSSAGSLKIFPLLYFIHRVAFHIFVAALLV